MAELLILLRRDPATGKQNVIVKLESEPDALPLEHEQLHRKLVEKLVGAGMKAEDLGEVIITREGEAVPIRLPEAVAESARKQAAQSGK